MASISEALRIALQHHERGQIDIAEEIYRRILEASPQEVNAIHLLGLIAHQRGMHAIAAGKIERAIQLKGNEAVLHNNLGGVYRAMGRIADAAGCYRRALELEPGLAEAHNNLGAVLAEQGGLGESIACYRCAVALKPDYAEAFSNLAVALTRQANFDEAIACCRRALSLNPGLAEAYGNLGNAFKGQGRLADAVDSYRRAVSLQPGLVEVLINLGNAYQDLGKLEEAVGVYRQALQAAPGSADAHRNLGTALHREGDIEGAIACYRHAVELKADDVAALNNLGAAMAEQGMVDEAIDCHRRALELKADCSEAYNNLGHALKNEGEIDEAIDCFRRAFVINPDYVESHSNLLYTLHYCLDYGAEEIFDQHRVWSRKYAEKVPAVARRGLEHSLSDRRLRVGYVSANFRRHPLFLIAAPLLSAHDHHAYEVYCYSDVTCPDAWTKRICSYADEWRDVRGMSDEQVAEMVRQDQIDILVDLGMHMAHNRLLVFARRPAPIQVTWCAYPSTTGLSAIDYRLTDSLLDPPGANDAHYTEQSVRLPDSFWCYLPDATEPLVNSLPAAERGRITFGCLNNFCKVNRSVLRLWARTMAAVERSTLLLLAPEGASRSRVREVLEREGVSSDRVQFVGLLPRPRYLELYHEIDICLDTFPYNGHTTSLDSLWMGVPVVSLAAHTAVGRGGLSILTNVGLPELVSRDDAEYVRIAVGLANDLPRLSLLRATLRPRMENSPLMNATRFARNVESAYREMWRRRCMDSPGGAFGFDSPSYNLEEKGAATVNDLNALNLERVTEGFCSSSNAIRHLPFRLHDFTRVSWASDAAREVWQPRIGRVSNAWLEIEWLAVVAGLRACCITTASPEKFVECAAKWATHEG